MLFYTLGQSAAFLLMLPAGLMTGLIWDALRLLRRLLKPELLLSLVIDLLFSLTAAALFSLGLFKALHGELRLYALMGALCGFLLYGATLSPLAEALFSFGGRLARHLAEYCRRASWLQRLLR